MLTGVTAPCATVQYMLIMFVWYIVERWNILRHDGKPIKRNAELRTVRFGYWKTEIKPSDGFPQTPSHNSLTAAYEMCGPNPALHSCEFILIYINLSD